MLNRVMEEKYVMDLLCECEPLLDGKKIALFGSYGWGDGQWMRDWEETCTAAGASLVSEPVICNSEPEDPEPCLELGKALGA